MMTLTPVLAFVDQQPLDWGLDPVRLQCPVTILVPGDTNPLAGRTPPPGVRVLTLDTTDDLTTTAGRLRLLARCADSGADDDLWVWVDAMYAASRLSHEVLYSTLFAKRVVADRQNRPVVYGHHGLDGNPLLFALTRRELRVATRFDDRTLNEAFNPYPPGPATKPSLLVDFVHLAHRPSMHFLRSRTEPVVHIIGDSHTLFCFTPPAAIGSRDDIVVDLRDVTRVPLPFRWQVTHHRGSRTMYRVASDAGELGPASLEEIDVRDGDTMVFVFGEIDVRAHIIRQQQIQGRPIEDIVEQLAAAYIDRLADVARRHPRSRLLVFGVIPPFDPPKYGPEHVTIAGALAQRVTTARLLNTVLERRATSAGLVYFDAYNELAGPDGSLPCDRSDHFCHVSRDWSHVAVGALYDRLASHADI